MIVNSCLLEEHEFFSYILPTKASFTPLRTGQTIPRSKISRLLLCSRHMSGAVFLHKGGFGSVSCLGYSMCIISSLEKNFTTFNPFTHARLSEIHSLRQRIVEKNNLEDVFHIISSDNIADIYTSRKTDLKIISPNSDCDLVNTGSRSIITPGLLTVISLSRSCQQMKPRYQ